MTDFVVGVVPHFGQGTAWSVAGPMLRDLGVKNIRDQAPPANFSSDGAYASLAQAGIKLCAMCVPDKVDPLNGLIARLEAYEKAFPGTLDAIEGPNEINNFPISYNGQSGTAAALAFQADLYKAVKASATLSHLPFVHMTGTAMTATCDKFNQHVYVHPFGGDDMNRHLLGSTATPTATLPKLVPGLFTQYANYAKRATPPFSNKPIWITESGYSTHNCTPQQQADFIVRDLQQAKAAGIERVYLYELIDDPKVNNPVGKQFGLFSKDGTAKPVVQAVANFLAPSTIEIGMNLVPTPYFGEEHPWLNRMRTAGSFSVYGGSAARDDFTVDSATGFIDGFKNSSAVGFNFAVATGQVDEAPNKNFILKWSGGDANVSALFGNGGTQGTVTCSRLSANRWNIACDGAGLMWLFLGIEPANQSDFPSDMILVRADQEELLSSGEIFNPEFVSQISKWNYLRPMQWLGADDPAYTPIEWVDRTQVAHYTYADSGVSVPIEMVAALANETKQNVWINVPHKASDDYVRQMATYLQDNLSTTAIVEYTNEHWNYGFAQYAYCLQQSQADPRFSGNPQRFYGYRAAQIAKIFRDVFGVSDKLKMTLGTQMAWFGLEAEIFNGVALANVGDVFDYYAVANYFGSDLSGNQSAADQTLISQWADASNVAAALQVIEHGTGLTTRVDPSSLDWYRYTGWPYHAAVAKQHGLQMITYEGGPGTDVTSFSADLQGKIVGFQKTYCDDPAMAGVYQRMVSEAEAGGVVMLTAFTALGSPSVHGYWGHQPSLATTSVRKQTLLEMIGD